MARRGEARRSDLGAPRCDPRCGAPRVPFLPHLDFPNSLQQALDEAERKSAFAELVASLGDDVPLSDGDFDTERWNYVSPDAYQAEVVWLLQWEEEKRGPRTRVEAVAEKASSACAVS